MMTLNQSALRATARLQSAEQIERQRDMRKRWMQAAGDVCAARQGGRCRSRCIAHADTYGVCEMREGYYYTTQCAGQSERGRAQQAAAPSLCCATARAVQKREVTRTIS